MWPVDEQHTSELDETLRAAERSGEPVALLGTSFAFVHALDLLGSTRYALPEGQPRDADGRLQGTLARDRSRCHACLAE